jgi:membrane protease YdiL (CAAX protease family)
MNPPHDVSRLLPITVLVILIVTVLLLVERILASGMRNKGPLIPALLTFLVILSKTVIPLIVLWNFFDLPPDSWGWINGGLFQAVWKGLVLAVVMMAFIFVYQRYSYLLFGKPYTSTGSRFLNREFSSSVLGIGITAALLNAFGEEIIFRGMFFSALLNSYGTAVALFAQSFVFTIYHFFPLQNSLLLFIMRIFFGLGYLWSGSLLTPVLAHLIENGLPAFIFLVRTVRTR